MDGGRLLCTGAPAEVGGLLRQEGHRMFLASHLTPWICLGAERCPLPGDGGGQSLPDGVAHGSPRPAPAAGGDPSLRCGGAGGGGRVVQIRGKGPGYRPGPPYDKSDRGICGPAGGGKTVPANPPPCGSSARDCAPTVARCAIRVGWGSPQNPQALFVKRPSGRICSRPSTDCICPGGAAAAGGADGDPLPPDGTAGPPSLRPLRR